MGLFFSVMGSMVGKPWLAMYPAVLFLALYGWSRKGLVLAAAITWFLYLPYEWAMKLRILCSGDCDIRLDLLLLYPALAVLSLMALIASIWPLAKRLRRGSG